MSEIYGFNVDFSSDADSAKKLLKEGFHHSEAEKFLDRADTGGRAEFYDSHGQKFVIENTGKDEGGKSKLRVRKSTS